MNIPFRSLILKITPGVLLFIIFGAVVWRILSPLDGEANLSTPEGTEAIVSIPTASPIPPTSTMTPTNTPKPLFPSPTPTTIPTNSAIPSTPTFTPTNTPTSTNIPTNTPTDTPIPTNAPTSPEAANTSTIPSQACPWADAEGTVSPVVTLVSVTFVVNGAEQIVDDFGALQASAGDQATVKEVTICVDPFEGNGGKVYVEFDPVDTNGNIIASEVVGTRAIPVISGSTSIPGKDYTWAIDDNWRHLSVNTVHYPAPPQETQNPNCESNSCEVDDRMIVSFE